MARVQPYNTSKHQRTKFDYFYLTEEEKHLIASVCMHPYMIKIAPLDKGLSGAKTILGQIHDRIKSKKNRYAKQISKLYVFKIGKADKIEFEHNQIKTIAERIIQGFPPTEIAYSSDKKLAIIKQEFLGDKNGSSLNLKRYIEDASGYQTVFEIVDNLYKNEIINWTDSQDKIRRIKSTFGEQLSSWLSKGPTGKPLKNIFAEESAEEIEKLLIKSYGLNFEAIQNQINDIAATTLQFATGPVHGDLHAENILITNKDKHKINLIDFGWTDYRWSAVDFIWLECSLKYVVCTPSVGINTYLLAEDILDEHWDKEHEINYSTIESMIQGKSVAKIIAGMAAIRSNIKSLKILNHLADYRKGLILMTYSLLSVPKINKIYLIHSICNNLLKLNGRKRKQIGQYDILYGSRDLLWPTTPGRMVIKALDLVPESGLALDVGCGDGKNAAFLVQKGWKVDAVDISFLAVNSAAKRQIDQDKLKIWTNDACAENYAKGKYDLVVNYGLYHCLNDNELTTLHHKLLNTLKPGGIMAFCMLNDELPIPDNHGTSGKIILRPQKFIANLHNQVYDTIELYSGEIEEDHLPIVNKHKHAVTWGLFRKI